MGESKNKPENRVNSRKANALWNTLQGRQGHDLDKEPSDAFSVLLTFSLSPKRHVVVPGSIHQIRLAEKTVGEKNKPTKKKRKTKPCGSFLSAETGGDRLSEKVSIRLQNQSRRTLQPSTPQRTALLYAFLLESGLRRRRKKLIIKFLRVLEECGKYTSPSGGEALGRRGGQ